MAVEPRTKLTAVDLLRLRSDPAKRCELIDGELIEMPPPGARHGRLAFHVGLTLGKFVEGTHLGSMYAAETGFLIRRNPDRVRGPDVAFVSRERLPGPSPDGYLELAPDFVVEVVSPSDTATEVNERVEDWLQAGTLVVWTMDASTKTVLIWRGLDRAERRSGDDLVDAEPVLPGFRCTASELFPNDD